MLLLQDYFKIVIPCSQQNNISSAENHFEDFPSKEKKMLHYTFSHAFSLVILYFAILLLTPSTPKTKILDSTTHFSRFGQKIKFTIYLLLSTYYYSLRIFAYLRGVVPYISRKCFVCLVQDFFPRESYPL